MGFRFMLKLMTWDDLNSQNSYCYWYVHQKVVCLGHNFQFMSILLTYLLRAPAATDLAVWLLIS